MEILLLIGAFLMMLVAIAGSILPVIPGGPLLSWVGFVLFYMIAGVPAEWTFLIITCIVAVIFTLLDYLIPIYGTKKMGGTKYGAIGAGLGLLVGFFFPPIGILIGPFVGAFVGELIKNNNTQSAFKSALGSFVGFLVSTLMKIVVCFIYLGLLIWKTYSFWNLIF